MKKLDLYIDKDGEKLRCGYTTGSCATGAAKAAAIMLTTQEPLDFIKISTPSGIELSLEIENKEIKKDYAICSIIKDSGDDPDVTDGIEIFAKVSVRTDENIFITGGEGVGRITKKGIYGEIGDYAINPTPKKMIESELLGLGLDIGFNVEIFIPKGREISMKTFNKNIGIVDGISIIGTKGIVYPMSEEALIKSIKMEIDSLKLNFGCEKTLILTPGNYGEEYAKRLYGDIWSVQTSNYIGACLKYAYNQGFRDFLLIGHIGKFSKLSLGAFQTHNEAVDLRMEAFVYYLALEGEKINHLRNLNEILTAEEATNYCFENNLDYIFEIMAESAENKIKKYLKDQEIKVKVKLYSMSRGVLND